MSRGLLRCRSLSKTLNSQFKPKGHAINKVYIGIDAHKATNLLAYAFEGHEPPDLIGRVSTDLNRTLDAIRRFMKKHNLKKEQLQICYEAGPTGFFLARLHRAGELTAVHIPDVEDEVIKETVGKPPDQKGGQSSPRI